VKGGEAAQLYEVRLVRRSRTKFVDQRRDVYDLTMERRDPVFEEF